MAGMAAGWKLWPGINPPLSASRLLQQTAFPDYSKLTTKRGESVQFNGLFTVELSPELVLVNLISGELDILTNSYRK